MNEPLTDAMLEYIAEIEYEMYEAQMCSIPDEDVIDSNFMEVN